MTNRITHFIRAIICATVIVEVIRILVFEPSRSDATEYRNLSPSSLTEGCLTSQCIDTEARALARVFPDKTDQEWCISKGNANRTPQNGNTSGIILVKVPKAASSTSAGVALRIADRLHCDEINWVHEPGIKYANRDKQRSYAFMTIRDPGARAISRVFFTEVSRGISRGRMEIVKDSFLVDKLKTSTNFQYGTRSIGQGGFQLRYAAPQSIAEDSMWNSTKKNQVHNPDLVVEVVKDVLQHYDFILVTERMDESLVAMALRMGIDVGDVLVTASKVAGSAFFLVNVKKKPRCLALAKSYVSPTVAAYLASDEWRAANYGDYLLHQAANVSLDQTIEAIGRQRFDRAMAEYRRLRAIEEKECAPYVQFPCSNAGQPQTHIAKESCYRKDFGCGHKCIDAMLEREAKNRSRVLHLNTV